MERATHVTAAANAVLERIGFANNPYFGALKAGSIPLEKFRSSQEQFYFAVQYFSRPMAALIARIPDPVHRLDILHNIVEEHGDFREDLFHQNTFRKFLASIGGHSPDQAGVTIRPAVHAFNSILMAACAHDDVNTAICCMGIIEHGFAGVSALIAKSVVQNNWVAAGNLVHYAVHAELDVVHAEEFFAIVESAWENPAGNASIRAGLELGAYAFDRLYRDLAE